MANCPIKLNIGLQSLVMMLLENLMPFIRRIIRQRTVLSLLFIFVFTVNVCSLPLWAAEVNGPVRVRIFPMRNITAQQGKDFLTASKLSGSAVVIPGTTALSVTSDPQTLVYAGNLLKLVDQNEPYEIKFFTLDGGKQLPSNDATAEKLGPNFNVGTLLEGNASSQAVKVIIDTIDGQPVIIAPKAETQTLIKIVNELAAAPVAAEVQTKTADVNLADVNSEPNFAVESQAVVETNDVPAAEAKTVEPQKTANDVDGLSEFMNELAEAAKAEKAKQQQEAAKLDEQLKQAQAEIAKAQQEANEAKPVSSAQQPKLEETVKLTPEINDVLAQAAKTKTPAINEVNIPNKDEVLELNLPEKLEIVTLIELVGKYLNLNYLYDETKVMGAVSIKVQGKIRVGELYSLLESVLKFKNLAMSRKGNLVTIVPVAEALDQDPVLVDGNIKPGDIAVTKVMRLKYISTDSAQNLLAQMKLGSNITPIKEISTLVITEYAFRMQRIEDLLALVDVPGEPKDFKLRVLKYTIAESLVTKIKALAEQLGTVDITVGATSSTADSAMAGRIARPVRPVPQPGVPTGATTTGETTAKSVYVDFDKRTNRILMIGLPTELSAVDKIIDSLDVPQQDLRTIREYEIQFIDIMQIVDALRELNIIEGTTGASSTSGTSRRTTINRQGGDAVPQPQVVQQQMAGENATGANLLDQPQVVMLEATNSLLINATPEQHTQISQIIAYIDREPVETAIPYRIYRLENQDPEKLAETLNSLIEKTVKDKEGKIQQTVKYTEDNIVIVPDVATFSVIVYASKKNQDWIGNLIKTLDTRRPQVLIDVTLVEVTKNDAFQFDLDMVTNAKDFVTNNVGTTTAKLNSALGDRIEAKFDSGTTYGYYSADRIQALLKLVDTKGYGRVLAQPKVLVNDNEDGTINTSSERYVAEETQSYPGTTTGSTPIPVVSKTWKSYTAKIELKIKPQISEGDLLRLEIEMVREDFGAKEATDAPPPKTISNVTTVVTVPDGSTIILGGLNKLNQTKTTGKTPLLGDIPLAGGLFRNVDNSNEERRLYVFVKANISRPDARSSLNQLKQISKKNQIEFERHEEKFQKHQSFPGIDDRIIEPAKILEQDDANTVEIK
jgi:type II secretory pathway component GspD/PulD (secretin)